jgi:hypothetical protein
VGIAVDSTRIVSRAVVLAVGVLALPVIVACGSNPRVAKIEQCHEQITLSLAPGVARTDRVIDGLQEGADVNLLYVRASSPNLFVYALSTPARDPGCTRALSRLRQDSRVRFAEPDYRRTVHGFTQ